MHKLLTQHYVSFVIEEYGELKNLPNSGYFFAHTMQCVPGSPFHPLTGRDLGYEALGDEDVLSLFRMFHNAVGCNETQNKSSKYPVVSEYPPTFKLLHEPTLWERGGGGKIRVIWLVSTAILKWKC